MLCCIERFTYNLLSSSQHGAHTGGVNKAAKVHLFCSVGARLACFLRIPPTFEWPDPYGSLHF